MSLLIIHPTNDNSLPRRNGECPLVLLTTSILPLNIHFRSQRIPCVDRQTTTHKTLAKRQDNVCWSHKTLYLWKDTPRYWCDTAKSGRRSRWRSDGLSFHHVWLQLLDYAHIHTHFDLLDVLCCNYTPKLSQLLVFTCMAQNNPSLCKWKGCHKVNLRFSLTPYGSTSITIVGAPLQNQHGLLAPAPAPLLQRQVSTPAHVIRTSMQLQQIYTSTLAPSQEDVVDASTITPGSSIQAP